MTAPRPDPKPERGPAAYARDQLEQRYRELGLETKDFATNGRGTIVGVLPSALTAAERSATIPLGGGQVMSTAADQSVIADAGDLDPTDIALGEVVGTGGMGIVNAAEQRALRREVAVKSVRPEKRTAASVSALLREAWVTGSLEHPNVVPVHLLLLDDEVPRVVMKRIEGVTWDTLIHAPTMVPEFAGRTREDRPREELLFHLGVLIDVCQAIAFAHARGVLHLDLKPDNVMVGRFGEVCVVDWGIAASLPNGPPWLPAAKDIDRVRGTPNWMPPELAAADSNRIGVCSDVYMLGGLLHAILTGGQPLHRGQEMIELLAQAAVSWPHEYDASVPAELAELAHRATSRDPDRRPSSAEAFRRALEDYLEHRHSSEIAESATATKTSLLERFAHLRHEGPTSRSPAESKGLRREFLECRFAFRQALQIWPGNQAAQGGLQELLRAMARHALDREQLEVAAEAVSELSPADPALEAELETLERALAGRHQRLLSLERDASIEPFRERRSLLSLGAGVLFIIWNVTCGTLHRSGAFVFGLDDLLWLNAATFAIFVVTAVSIRKTLLTTATNRRMVVLFGTGFVAVGTFWIAAWVHGQTHPERALGALEVVALSNWVYPFFILAIGFTTDRRVMWVAPPVIVIATLAPMFEEYAFEILGLGGFICGAWLAYIWRHAGRRSSSAG